MRAVFVALFLIATLSAQGQGFSIQLGAPQPAVVRLGGRVSVELSVNQPGDATLEDLPKVKNLRAQVFGPNSQVYQSFVGGRRSVSRTRTWRIVFEPTEGGDFEVPPLRVRAGGKVYETKATRFTCEVARSSSAFIEVAIEPPQLSPGQEATMRIRLGIEPQQYQRLVRSSRLENVRSMLVGFPAWDKFEGGSVDEDVVTEIARDQLALRVNDGYRVARDLGVQKRKGESFHVLELRKRLRAERVGRFEMPRATMRYRWVVRYGRDLFGDLVPADARDEYARSEPFVLVIEDLPKEGRPDSFAGAVGTLEMSAKISKSEVKVGESFALELHLHGTAISDSFDAPALAESRGFHVFGKKSERGDQSLTVRYDITALTPGEQSLPAVEIAHYDPEKRSYEIARAGPFKIVAAAVEGAKSLEALPESKKALRPGVDDLWDRMDARGAPPERFRPSSTMAWLALGSPLLLFLLGLVGFRAQRRRRDDVVGKRKRGARRAFDENLASEGPLLALSHFLADRLDWEPGAVLGRDLSARLCAAGLSEERARQTSELFDRLEAGRYAGGDEEALVREAGQLVERLEKELS